MLGPVSPAAALQRVLPADRHLFVVCQYPWPPPPPPPFGPPMKPIFLLGPAAAWTSNVIGLPMEHILLLRPDFAAATTAARVMPGGTPVGERSEAVIGGWTSRICRGSRAGSTSMPKFLRGDSRAWPGHPSQGPAIGRRLSPPTPPLESPSSSL
jgi:hypothetical protein